MIENDLALADGDYLLLTGFFNLPPELCGPGDLGGDMMGSVIRPRGWPATRWRFRWRFRYYRDAHIWGSSDRKNWFRAELKDLSEAAVEIHVREFIDRVILGAAGQFRASVNPEIFVVAGDHHKLTRMLASGQRPGWMHALPEGKQP